MNFKEQMGDGFFNVKPLDFDSCLAEEDGVRPA